MSHMLKMVDVIKNATIYSLFVVENIAFDLSTWYCLWHFAFDQSYALSKFEDVTEHGNRLHLPIHQFE